MMNDLPFVSLSLFGNEEVNIYIYFFLHFFSSILFSLLTFLCHLPVWENFSRTFFTFDAYCSRQERLTEVHEEAWAQSIKKAPLMVPSPPFFFFFCEREAQVWKGVSCVKELSDNTLGGGVAVSGTVGDPSDRPFHLPYWSLFSFLSSFISFTLVCYSSSTVWQQLGMSVYGRKLSWCETWSNL